MPTTHAIMVMDMSGSMSDRAAAVRSGFNEYVAGLPDDTDDMRFRVTAYTFNVGLEALAVKARKDKVPQLDHALYHPHAMTALLDAIGTVITNFRDSVTLKKKDRVLLVVHTDGQENASREYTFEKVEAMVKELEATGKWGFIYVGAGLEAWGQGHRLSMSSLHTNSSPRAQESSYDLLRAATSKYAGGQSVQATVDWMEREHISRGTAQERPEPTPDPGEPA